jgi:hypothetical protein
MKGHIRVVDMGDNVRARSTLLVFLLVSRVLISFIGPASTVAASNETSVGTITGTETWSGLHQLTGDVTIATGAQVSVPVIVPTEVSFEAATVDAGPIKDIKTLDTNKNTRSVLRALTLSPISTTLM